MIKKDSYTEDTKNWLDQRFKQTDKDGIFLAHQPIYGFRKGHCDSNVITRYIPTYQILKALSHLKFSSFLDVGGAEGYKAALTRSVFNVKVHNCDLSKEAAKRAKDIFNIESEPIDIHRLPYKDNEFDVVLCSETLEHVTDIEIATKELVRVCSKAVVITVPHESKNVIEKNIKEKIPHAHIHSLDTTSFNFILPKASKILTRKMLSPLLRVPREVMDGVKKDSSKLFPQIILDVYNFCVPFIQTISGKKLVETLIKSDDFLSNALPYYSGLLFILLKDDKCYSKHQHNRFSFSQFIDFHVPYYYL